MSENGVIILGAGVTGLAAGLASGVPVYEMSEAPGGICASYYRVRGEEKRFHNVPSSAEAYRFEIGGGHWLWGGDPVVLRFMESMAELKRYARRAAVYFPDRNAFVPYPLQNNLRCLGPTIAKQALCEMSQAWSANHTARTMAEWLQQHFGPTLCRLFFDPFHELYTAGLWKTLAPQDESKSPVNISLAVEGAFEQESRASGYNTKFSYPIEGLNVLAQRMAQRCAIHYEKRLVRIDSTEKILVFSDGSSVRYEKLLCTLPLSATLQMAGLKVSSPPDPYTSVMVLNIGARKGPCCPREHWLYIPRSEAGFHRVGFYSNVDVSFLPATAQDTNDHASIYVEKAYPGGLRPSDKDVQRLGTAVIRELQNWRWIEDIDVLDPTWVETAYTWVWPGSQWRQEAMQALEAHGIYQLGRYGRWAPQLTDQGIAQSIRDGLWAGASFRACN